MGEKRVTQQVASDEIYNDDWFLKDSVLHDTTKVQPSVIKEYVNQGMATATALANEATARANADTALGGRIDKALANEAETYNPSKTYVNGDYCIHEDNLYICNASTGTSGQWNRDKWTQIAVGSELKALWADLASERTTRQQADTALGQRIDALNFSADAISYDNTSSGLEADNVQDAIGETITKLSAVGTASGDIATFTDGSDLSMPKLEVAIEPVQEGSGDPSPENIRPIIGWDEVNVGVVGKNLYKAELNNYYLDVATGLPIAQEGYEISGFIPILANQSIYIPGSGSSRRWFYDKFKNPKTYLNNSDAQTYTAQEDGYIRVTLNKTISTYSTYQIEYGSTATTYEPYNGHTYTIDLDGTRYGGKVDLVSGVMTVEKASIKLSDLIWTKQNTANNNWRFKSSPSIQNIKIPTNAAYKIDNLCSVYRNITANETWTADDTGIAINADASLLICDLNQADTTALGVVIANQTYCYKLATPLTIQLTPTVVKSLRGMNNVFADTGAILDAEYIRDLTAIINYILEQLGN